MVSFPSWELFEPQSIEYKDSVFTPGTRKCMQSTTDPPTGVPVLSIEASASMGWEKVRALP